MSDNVPYADILILALAAGFILLRLRSILGSKSDHDPMGFMRGMSNPLMDESPLSRAGVVQLDEKSLKQKPPEESDPYMLKIGEGPLADTLRGIKTKDASFAPTLFMQGAKAAFEMVFDAFAKADEATRTLLMSDAVLSSFQSELKNRAAAPDYKQDITLVSVVSDGIVQAQCEGNIARLTVRFLSEQVHLVRNAKNEIIEGNPSEVQHVEDHWTFERDITSKNPNWKIIET